MWEKVKMQTFFVCMHILVDTTRNSAAANFKMKIQENSCKSKINRQNVCVTQSYKHCFNKIWSTFTQKFTSVVRLPIPIHSMFYTNLLLESRTRLVSDMGVKLWPNLACSVIVFGLRGNTNPLLELARRYYTAHVLLIIQIPEYPAGIFNYFKF